MAAIPGCVIRCSQVYNDDQGKFMTSGFEYETIWALGANATISNLDQIAEADQIMDDLGLDSIETSVMFGVAMQAGVLKWGDGAEVLRILREEIGKGTPLGRVLGAGTAAVGKAYGVTRVPVVKNQAIPAYDPRAVKGIGITYATTPDGSRPHVWLFGRDQHPGCRRTCRPAQEGRPDRFVAQFTDRNGGRGFNWACACSLPFRCWTMPLA